MKVSSLIILICLAAFSLSSCKSTKVSPCENAVEGKLVNLAGLDGCSWAIELEDGSKLEPINLKEFDIDKKNNKKVWVSYENADGYVSICMVGQIVRIKCLSER